MAEHEPIEWDTEVRVEVTIKINAKSNPEFYDGLMGRTPLMLAQDAIRVGRENPERIDGWADLVGEVRIIDTQEAV